jgi:serine/threonine-protein kinase RsbW
MSPGSTLKVPARGDQLAVIGDFVTAAARRAGFGERAVYHIQAAVDEACANIVYHAYEFEGQGSIEVRCERSGGDFVITITDQGQAFDPTSIPTPDVNAPLDDRKEGGLGRFLMKQLMDDVTHQFTNHSNILTMVKHLPST